MSHSRKKHAFVSYERKVVRVPVPVYHYDINGEVDDKYEGRLRERHHREYIGDMKDKELLKKEMRK